MILSAAACGGEPSSPPAAVRVDSGADAGKKEPDATVPRDATRSDGARDAREASDDASSCTEAVMDFTGGGGFFDAPFPSDARLTAAGGPDLTGFPNPAPSSTILAEIVKLVASSARGFALTSSVYFHFTGPLTAAGLDDVKTSLTPAADVFILDVDSRSAGYGKRAASRGLFVRDGGPFGAPNLLAVLPFQGVPLSPSTRYAAVVLRATPDAKGRPLCAAPAMKDLVAKKAPSGMSAAVLAEYEDALGALGAANVAADDIAAMTVFTTDDPVAQFQTVRDAMQALPVPAVKGTWTKTDEFPTYCVFANTIPMPEYQSGKPPYETSGGTWAWSDAGAPVLQREELANFIVTIPRAPMPASGYPVVNMSRTGAGGNRPLVDRGTQATNGGPPITPGTGPALYFAAAGFAGASIDGPLGGLRNPDGRDTADNEDYTVFNVSNPGALRDNLRQSAAELSLTASILAGLHFDASSCPGATTTGGGPVSFDVEKMGLFSHSMGSTISPLTLAFEPRYKVAILSGAGGSWIENIIYKLLPAPPLKQAVEFILGIASSNYMLGEGDPAVNLFQWAIESADAPIYDSRTIQHPVGAPARSVLKVQGIIDHYILPNICNATTLSLGLDLAGPELDTEPALAMYQPFEDVMFLSGRGKIALPASGNVRTADGGAVTAIVRQHPADGIEDGHEVIFQTDAPKHEYTCFLASFAAGKTPRIPAPTDAGAIAPCE